MRSLRIEPMTLALLTAWSTVDIIILMTKPTVSYFIFNFPRPLNCQHFQNLLKNLLYTIYHTSSFVRLMVYTLLASKRPFSIILKTFPFRLWFTCLLQNHFHKVDIRKIKLKCKYEIWYIRLLGNVYLFISHSSLYCTAICFAPTIKTRALMILLRLVLLLRLLTNVIGRYLLTTDIYNHVMKVVSLCHTIWAIRYDTQKTYMKTFF